MDMRVANTYNAYSVYNVKNNAGVKKADKTGKADSQRDVFSLSSQAEDYQTARKALSGIPDIRSDRVNQLRSRIESGAYRVSDQDVAQNILKGLDD